jgi:hypothetical protein
MQIQYEISNSERNAVKRHLGSTQDKLPLNLINKMLSKYEITLQNKLQEITNLKMELDDRDIAVDLFFRKKLKSEDIKNLIKSK